MEDKGNIKRNAADGSNPVGETADNEFISSDIERLSNADLPLIGRMVIALLVSPLYSAGIFVLLKTALPEVIAFAGQRQQGIGWILLGLTLLAAGPIAFTLSLSPNRRGCLASVAASLAIFFVGMPVGGGLSYLIRNYAPLTLSQGEAFELTLPLAGTAIGVALVACLLTGYLRGRSRYVGFAAGVVVGVLLVGMQSLRGQPDLIGPIAFVWTSVIYFPTLFQRRKFRLGFVVWLTLQAVIFMLGIDLSRFLVGVVTAS